MPLNISQLRSYLSENTGSALYRQVCVLAGEETWQKEILKEILLGNEVNTLWVTEKEEENNGYSFVTTKKTHTWLGSEKKVVVFDASNNFDPDGFAAISGIVVGGGLFFLLMPEVDKWNLIYSTPFGQRLIKSINTTNAIMVIKENDEKVNFNQVRPITSQSEPFKAPFLTADQQHVVEAIENEVLNNKNNPVVVVSDRGRGKSAALGFVAARLLNAGIKSIAITAPRLRAADIIFKHIIENSPEAEVKRGSVKVGDGIIQFYAPDELVQGDIDAELLLVDEAAAIPVAMLSSYLDNYKQCIFATTVHGYEGTGRGFALRFNKVLTKRNPSWLKLQMETPIRWAANDPLEKWVFNLLCLDAEIVDIKSIQEIEQSKFECQLLDKRELTEDQTLLNEIFALLVLAHYRTRPNDLKVLFDDNVSLYVTRYKKHVVAVALVIREGSFSDSLSTDVYRGERRPQGHLLAQALTYHCGIEQAATLDYARVMRIAVHPDLQRQGIGSVLLNFIVTNEQRHGRDAIGSSFGMNMELLQFWRKLKFNVVRIGFTREQTSGEHAAIMLLPLTEKAKILGREASERFNDKLPYWFNDVLKDIPLEIKNSFECKISDTLELSQYDKKDLISFSKYSRNYELCISAINKFAIKKQEYILQEQFPKKLKKIIEYKIESKFDWKEVGKKMKLRGQNEARILFRSAICFLIDKT